MMKEVTTEMNLRRMEQMSMVLILYTWQNRYDSYEHFLALNIQEI